MRLRPKTISATKSAFTFIELLLVVIIISALTVMATPRVKKALDGLSFQIFARDILYLMRYLQNSALSERKVYRLTIASDEGLVYASVREQNDFKPLAGRFGRKYKAPQGVTVTHNQDDGADIFFFPDGTSGTAAITIENKSNDSMVIENTGIISEFKIQN